MTWTKILKIWIENTNTKNHKNIQDITLTQTAMAIRTIIPIMWKESNRKEAIIITIFEEKYFSN